MQFRSVLLGILFSSFLTSSIAQLPNNPEWTEEAKQDTQLYGEQMAMKGDYNGDGHKDLVVGAPRTDSAGMNDVGKVYLYLGSDTGLTDTAVWTAYGKAGKDFFGGDLSYAGDVDDDGYDDLIVGAPESDSGMTNRGSAFLFRGNASGLADTASSVFYGEQAYAYFARSVSNAGDVNDDGYDDVIVGAFQQDSSNNDAGRAYLYRGSASGLSDTAVWVEGVHESNAWFGRSVSYAGDVNGDGYDDVVVGCPKKGNATDNYGRVYFYYGSSSGLPDTSSYWLTPAIASDGQAGRIVTAAGDIDNDGYDDVVFGSDAGGAGGLYASGEAWAVHGGPSGVQISSLEWNYYPPDNYMRFSDDMVNAGDVNGDGYDDLLVGAPEHSSDKGKIYLFTGSDTGYADQPTSTYEGDQIQSYFGTSLAAGDVDEDGHPDFAVGANRYNGTYSDAGKVFAFLGVCGKAEPDIKTSPNAVCEGDSVLMEVDSGYVSYAWSTGDSTRSIEEELTDSTLYSVTTVTDSGCSVSDDTMLAPISPDPSFTDLDTLYCTEDSSVTLKGDPSGGSFSGTGVSGAEFDPQAAGVGSHSLSYSYTDSNGCSAIADTTVRVQESCATGFPSKDMGSAFELYPNPSEGTLFIEISDEVSLRTLELYDIRGGVAEEMSVEQKGSKLRLDISDLSEGVYLLRIATQNGEEVRRVIKQ